MKLDFVFIMKKAVKIIYIRELVKYLFFAVVKNFPIIVISKTHIDFCFVQSLRIIAGEKRKTDQAKENTSAEFTIGPHTIYLRLS